MAKTYKMRIELYNKLRRGGDGQKPMSHKQILVLVNTWVSQPYIEEQAVSLEHNTKGRIRHNSEEISYINDIVTY